MARDRDRWRAVVDTAMNIRVPKRRGISSLAERTISFSKKKTLRKARLKCVSHWSPLRSAKQISCITKVTASGFITPRGIITHV